MGNQQPVNGSGHPAGLPPGDSTQQQQSNQNQQQQHQHQQQLPPGAYAGAYIPTHGGGQQQQQGQGQGGFLSPPFGGGDSHQQQQSQQQNMQRSASDASMTIMDSDISQQHHHHHHQQHGGVPPIQHQENWLDDDTVPTVFRWEHGGRQVYITGTFNGWSRQIPMHRSGNDFTYIHNLKRGKHAFKFIVDDEWRFAPDQPTVADTEGRINNFNNFIDVTDFKPYTGDKDFEKEKTAAEYGVPAIAIAATDDNPANEGETDETAQGGGAGIIVGGGGTAAGAGTGKGGYDNKDADGEVFSHNMPDLDDYTKEPPPLPPHLRHIILNKPPQLSDTAALPVPQHVALNHLYCTAIKDNMMVLGITQRYKTKFVTTVYYSPCSSK